MKAVITGATSGIGRDMARILAHNGWDLILTGRNSEELEFLKSTLPVNVETIVLDLAKEKAPFKLYSFCKGKKVDMLINNAGFGAYGKFSEVSLETELDMIAVNVRAVHILTKLFLRDFRKRNRGRILNVSSVAGLMTGPLMSAYYASKNYVTRLSLAIAEELRRENSRVTVSVLCPGPVRTRFNERAGADFRPSHTNSYDVAKYALEQTLDGKKLIIPGNAVKLGLFAAKLVPHEILPSVLYEIQSRRGR
ncbi:MAG: SDR family oxidoreductase [Oscillospiraceae bacterium]|nr:SDR family oxidoreductase [Oscillospiraceae bacterium]